MDQNALIDRWKAEEKVAYIHGWDFSHIAGRYTEQDALPWDYRLVIGEHLRPEMRILDIDTGGGEFLLSLNHPHENTAAMENYPPNVELCKEVLLPLGVDFRASDGKGKLPFDDDSFDMVINRHGNFHAEEIYRVLKPGGLFITQQVGAENDRELVELLCGKTPLPFPEQYLNITMRKFESAGFNILRGEEVFRPIRFFDVGALVWFARIIQWEFPGFSVDTHLANLLNAQRILEDQGSIQGSIHRFLLVAQKEKAEGETMLEKMCDFFEARLDGYDEHMMANIASATEFYPFTAGMLPTAENCHILDLGCGTGLELSYYLAENPSARITGIDLSKGMLNALQKKFCGKNLHLVCGSYFDVPFGERCFDAAVSVESLHHFTQEAKIPLYTKLYRSLKPGGYFILTDYFSLTDEEERAFFAELARLKAEQGISDEEFYHFDTPLTVSHEIEALSKAGFSAIEVLKSWGPTYTIKAKKEIAK